MFGHQATNSSLNRDRFRGKRSFCFGFFSSGGIRPWPSHFCITIDHLFVVIAATTKHRERQPKKKGTSKKSSEKRRIVLLCAYFFLSLGNQILRVSFVLQLSFSESATQAHRNYKYRNHLLHEKRTISNQSDLCVCGTFRRLVSPLLRLLCMSLCV